MFKVVKDHVQSNIHTLKQVDEANIFAFHIDENTIYKLARVKYDEWAWVTISKVGHAGDHYFSSTLYPSKMKAIEFAEEWIAENYKESSLNEFADSKEFFKWCIEVLP